MIDYLTIFGMPRPPRKFTEPEFGTTYDWSVGIFTIMVREGERGWGSYIFSGPFGYDRHGMTWTDDVCEQDSRGEFTTKEAARDWAERRTIGLLTSTLEQCRLSTPDEDE
jgi:hypothetical protein